MKIDEYGTPGYYQIELLNALKVNPKVGIESVACCDPETYNKAIDTLYLDFPKLQNWFDLAYDVSVDEYHKRNQQNWLMPDQYKELDIYQFLMDRCKTDVARERVNEEWALYEQYGLVDLLRYLKYLVDLLQEKKIVMGVGRGSSCASYCLYLLKVHRIDSLKYGLDIREFLRDK